MLRDETANGFTGLCFVGNGYPGAEERRQHLAPCSPWLHRLINYSRVTCNVNGRNIFDRLNRYGTYAWMIAVELKGKFVVPVQCPDLPRLELYPDNRVS